MLHHFTISEQLLDSTSLFSDHPAKPRPTRNRVSIFYVNWPLLLKAVHSVLLATPQELRAILESARLSYHNFWQKCKGDIEWPWSRKMSFSQESKGMLGKWFWEKLLDRMLLDDSKISTTRLHRKCAATHTLQPATLIRPYPVPNQTAFLLPLLSSCQLPLSLKHQGSKKSARRVVRGRLPANLVIELNISRAWRGLTKSMAF